MKLKFALAAVILLFACNFLFAQKKQYVFFLTDSGKRVSTRDSCDFIRIITEPDSASALYGLDEYYKNNKPKLSGKAMIAGGPKLDGECVRYYPSGKRQSVSHYDKGRLTGHLYTFFPNGRLYDDKLIDDQKKQDDKRHDFSFTVVASNDSTGKEMVVEGNGHYIDYSDDFKWVNEEGDLKNSLKDGLWSGRFYRVNKTGNKRDSLTYVEKYENGKLISGKSTGFDKLTFEYTQREVEPSFKGGVEAFNRYLANIIRFPAEDRQNNVTGKVYVSFIIEKDGALSDIKAVRGPSETEKAEAVRAIQMSPKWIPGSQMGQPVRVSYTVPINFTLGDR